MYNPNINNRRYMDDNPNYVSANRPVNEENIYTEVPYSLTPLSTSLKDTIRGIFKSIGSSLRPSSRSSSTSSSTQFYVDINPNYASVNREPVESIAEESSDEEEYAEIDLDPPLPPRNGFLPCSMVCDVDTNPGYDSPDNIRNTRRPNDETEQPPTPPSRIRLERGLMAANPNYIPTARYFRECREEENKFHERYIKGLSLIHI